MPGTPSFQITVPKKSAAGQLPIVKLHVTVDVDKELAGGVAFTVTDPLGLVKTFPALAPGGGNSPLTLFSPAPAGAPAPNSALVVAPPTSCTLAGDPCRRRYNINFNLDATYDLNNFCHDLTAGAQTWTIAAPAGEIIEGVCVQSFDRNSGGNQCTAVLRVVPNADGVATVVGAAAPIGSCSDVRPGIDLALVLDMSGSMATTGADGTSRMDHLHGAVTDLVTRWKAIRASEAAAGLTNTDRIGVTLFDADAIQWSATPPSAAHLDPFDSVQATILAQVNTILPGSSTSIGDGLFQADTELSAVDATRRRVVLLMSDGLQNTEQWIAVNPATGAVATHTDGDPTLHDLPNQSNYQIYTVTVGHAESVSAKINQQVAIATHGFYVNTEDEASLLSPFFLELLQNFVKFNSWDTDRLVHATASRAAPYITTIPFTSTTGSVAMSLRWPGGMGQLELVVTPPGEKQPTVQSGSDSVTLDFSVPTSAAYDFTGTWQVIVRPASFEEGPNVDVRARGEGGGDGGNDPAIPFDLTVLSEDSALHTDLGVVGKDYVPGEQVQFELHVTEFGQAVTGLGSHATDRLLVEVVRPGANVGDLLATSTASTAPPFPTDPSGPVASRLHNELAANPGGLSGVAGDVVTLSHVGDGTYRGSYGVQMPGHYNFLFGVEGGTSDVGRFSRQRLETVYVRPAPSTSTTVVDLNVQNVGGGLQLNVSVTPKTAFGHLLGPGFANYIWFTAPGMTPVKPRDNMNGTYTATLPVSGATTPLVSIHFLDVFVVIGDNWTPEQLPVRLDDSNVLVASTVQQIKDLIVGKLDRIEDEVEKRVPGFEKLESLFDKDEKTEQQEDRK